MADIHHEFVVTLTAAEAKVAARMGHDVITVPAVRGRHGKYTIVRCGTCRMTANLLVNDVKAASKKG